MLWWGRRSCRLPVPGGSPARCKRQPTAAWPNVSEPRKRAVWLRHRNRLLRLRHERASEPGLPPGEGRRQDRLPHNKLRTCAFRSDMNADEGLRRVPLSGTSGNAPPLRWYARVSCRLDIHEDMDRALALGAVMPCFGQAGKAELFGTIQDPSVAVLANAKITAEDQATGAHYEATRTPAANTTCWAYPRAGTRSQWSSRGFAPISIPASRSARQTVRLSTSSWKWASPRRRRP